MASELAAAVTSQAAQWQYVVPVDAGRGRGTACVWIPPGVDQVRGVYLIGQLGIEAELANSEAFRAALAESGVAIVYFRPHIDALFHYWQNGCGDRLLKGLSAAARRSGHPELARVPWITAGHSTAGIYCRNVAYWKPDRVAGVLHIKSGNFWQKNHKPERASIAGVPLLAVNGQFETFGPEEGIDKAFGQETQWRYVVKNLLRFRAEDPQHLMGIWVDPGADHFFGRRALYDEAALFVRKTAQYRLPKALPAGDGPVKVLTVKAEDGWLVDPDLKTPKVQSAAYRDYAGDKSQALWFYDKEMAEASLTTGRVSGEDQALAVKITWLDEGDGYTFKASGEWLETMKDWYGGSVGGKKVTHADTPITYEVPAGSPVRQVGPDTFRVLHQPAGKGARLTVIGANAGDAAHRPTMSWDWPVWSDVFPPKGEDGKPKAAASQAITFPRVADVKVGESAELRAKASSGLPVVYEVGYGPVAVKDGKVVVDGLPTNPQFPIECRVTAWQIGRRVGELVAPAEPVSVVFNVVR